MTTQESDDKKVTTATKNRNIARAMKRLLTLAKCKEMLPKSQRRDFGNVPYDGGTLCFAAFPQVYQDN